MAIIIPTYGRHDLTQAVLRDLEHNGYPSNVYVIDNRGDFTGGCIETVVRRPRSNLGWAGGCNLGMCEAFSDGHESVVLLNNDTRLSHGFIQGLVSASMENDGGVIGPFYDHAWSQQVSGLLGIAQDYTPKKLEFRVPFIDGTCMMISKTIFEQVGSLDEMNWPRFGWGCDKDYCLRVRAVGGSVWVTARSYLNHFARGTSSTLHGFSEAAAELENNSGMEQKWGRSWRDHLYEGFDHVSRSPRVRPR